MNGVAGPSVGPGVRRRHERRLRLEDAVEHELHAVRPKAPDGRCGALALEGLDLLEPRVMLPPERGDDARGQPAGLGRLAVDGERLRSHDRVLPGGDPERVQVALGRAEPLEEVGAGRLRRVAVDELDGTVVQRAGRLTVGVADDPAVRWIGRRAVDPRYGEGARVGPRDVTVVALEEGRPIWNDRVEQAAVRLAAREGGQRPAAAMDPLAVGVGGRMGGDRFEVRGRIGQVVEVAAPGEHAALDRVDMRVLEAGQERLAVELDHPRSRPDQGPHIRRAPDERRSAHLEPPRHPPGRRHPSSSRRSRQGRPGRDRSVELMRNRS